MSLFGNSKLKKAMKMATASYEMKKVTHICGRCLWFNSETNYCNSRHTTVYSGASQPNCKHFSTYSVGSISFEGSSEPELDTDDNPMINRLYRELEEEKQEIDHRYKKIRENIQKELMNEHQPKKSNQLTDYLKEQQTDDLEELFMTGFSEIRRYQKDIIPKIGAEVLAKNIQTDSKTERVFAENIRRGTKLDVEDALTRIDGSGDVGVNDVYKVMQWVIYDLFSQLSEYCFRVLEHEKEKEIELEFDD